MRVDQFWRYGSLGLSIALYLWCLSLDAFCAPACQRGYDILIAGPFGLLASVTNWTWLANPVLFSAWFGLAVADRISDARFLAFGAGLAALVIAASFLLQREVMMNEAGNLNPIRAYGAGYWVWLSSMAVCCVGGWRRPSFGRATKIRDEAPAGLFRPLLPRTSTNCVSGARTSARYRSGVTLDRLMSVFAKSSPLNSSGSPRVMASA
ncbi:hypothetical protein ABH991_001354 [Bradyrhizobium ottawaense]|uniref:Uncharacterized protein n=1 Tax=Bradyrhizobium ottawaense TaxID=931866 RepID=A0ABV4FQA0_9BRAD